MADNEFDTDNSGVQVSDTGEANDNPGSGVQQADSPGPNEGGFGSTGFQGYGFQGPLQRASEARKAKMADILAGNYGVDDGSPAFRQAAPGTPSMNQSPSDGPWIGPDGGMIGRGIKAAGDWYIEGITPRRDAIMKTMEYELNKTITPQFVEGLKTWSTGTLGGVAGTKSEKPEFITSYFVKPSLALGLLPNTNLIAAGLKQRVNPVVPIMIAAGEAYNDAHLTNKMGYVVGKSIYGGVKELPSRIVNEPLVRGLPEVMNKQED